MKKHVQPHIMCGVGDVAKYVLLSGDPKRVEKIAALFDEGSKIAEYRGFITCTGSVDRIGISASSTGIGCPSAAIVVEELARVGAEVFIRVGTTGALQPEIKTGDIVVATAAVRADGASRRYMPLEFPAVADFDVTTALLEAAWKLKQKVHFGPVLTSDVFYGDLENLRVWSRYNVRSVEMESSVIFTIANLKKLKAGTILAVDGNPLLGIGKGEFELGERTGELDQRVQNAIKREAQIAIKAVKLLENRMKTKSRK
jgi:uridine phosphorylase